MSIQTQFSSPLFKIFILNNIDEKFILNRIRTYILYASSLEYKYLYIIIKGIENGAVVRKFDF